MRKRKCGTVNKEFFDITDDLLQSGGVGRVDF